MGPDPLLEMGGGETLEKGEKERKSVLGEERGGASSLPFPFSSFFPPAPERELGAVILHFFFSCSSSVFVT